MSIAVRITDTQRVLVASVIAAGSSFAISFLAARVLTPESNREFLVFWAVLFGVFGLLNGVQNETTRAVGSTLARRAGLATAEAEPTELGSGELDSSEQGPTGARGTRVLALSLLIGVAFAAIIALTSPLWAPGRFSQTSAVAVAIIAIAAVLYAGHACLAGSAAGHGWWRLYAGLMGAEAAGRLVFVGVVALVAVLVSSLEGAVLPLLMVATAAAAAIWLLYVAASPEARSGALARADQRPLALLYRYLAAIFTAGCTAVLITMFPVFVDVAGADVPAATVAGLLIALQLSRAPIMIPLQALQAMMLKRLLDSSDAMLRAFALPLGVLGAGALAIAVPAGLLGPWVLSLFNPLYVVSGFVFVGLVFAAAAVGALTLTGTACLARDSHVSYAAGWLVASVLGVALLWLPGSFTTVVVVALIAGPVAGVGVHLVCLAAVSRRSSRPAAAPVQAP